MPENIHHLIRLQRLAVIGASLPERPDTPRLSPSRIRDLLKQPMVSGKDVRAREDPYDDVYVVEVLFHGGPHRIVQGLDPQSGATLDLLLPALARESGKKLPHGYCGEVEYLAYVLLSLSEAVCAKAGLRRGITPPERRTDEVTVPGQRELDALCAAVTIGYEELAEFQGPVLGLIEHLSTRPGVLVWQGGDTVRDQLTLTPMLHTATGVTIVDPGGLAAALRHQILCSAVRRGCVPEVSAVYRAAAFAATHKLLSMAGARERTGELRLENAPVTRRRYSIADDKIIDLIVLTDDLTGYELDQPFGKWSPPGLGAAIGAWFDQIEDEADEANTLRLVITSGIGRMVHLVMSSRAGASPTLAMRPDELAVMVALDGGDPLFLWNFAVARRQLLANTDVVAFGMLELYAVYRSHDFSFCLSDEGPVDVLTIESDMALPLRIEVMQQADVHQVLSPSRPVYVEVEAQHGGDIAPIYACARGEDAGSVLVEHDGVHTWVLDRNPNGEALDHIFTTVCGTAAYWLWQLSERLPGLLSECSVGGRLIIEVSMDDVASWLRFCKGAGPADTDADWIAITCPRPGHMHLRLLAAGASRLAAEHNEPDRYLLTAVLTALVSITGWAWVSVAGIVDEIAPLGPKRMIGFAARSDELGIRPSRLRVRHVQPTQTARILDELGVWLSANGVAEGEIPAEERTRMLGMAVDHYFQLLTDAIALLSPHGLVEQLIARDEAVSHDAILSETTIVQRIALFGEQGPKTRDLIRARQSAAASAIASRFLIEYVAATPPNGDRELTLERYDYLLALADELTERGLLSDAIHHGFSDAELSLLGSGRLGVSRGGNFETGTDAFRAARIEELRRLAGEPAANSAERTASAPDQLVEAAMYAEFGFTFKEMSHGLGELVAFADRQGETEPCRAPRSVVCAHLMSALGWSEATVEAFLYALILEPREKFLSVKADAYPWRFNRAYSYVRRPLVLRYGDSGAPELLWGIRRTWDAGRYMVDLVYSGRLRATTPEMKRVCVTTRQGHNKDFERRVAETLASSGCDKTAHSIARINGRRLESAAGENLGDIDALGVDSRRHLIVVGEAKDFEVARTPAEMSNEAEALIHGGKSAAFKTARRAQWVRDHLLDVLAHFDIAESAPKWSVEAVIITSRDLLTPRVMSAPVPIVAIGHVAAWMAERKRRRE
jgi:hypothetical protein